MSTTIDLTQYKIKDVFAKKLTESTLKAVQNFEKKFDFNGFLKENETKSESVKVINADVIIAKSEMEREELLQKLLIYADFISYNIAKQLNTQQLKALYAFVKNFVSNSFLIKKELHIYDKKTEDFKIFDKEMFVTKVESVMDSFNFYTTETVQKRNGDVETKKIYAINAKKFFNYLKINAESVKNINVSVNPFINKTKFYIDKENKEAVLIKHELKLKQPNYSILEQIPREKKEAILEDYKKLWDNGEKLFETLDFIVYGRFMSARKKLQMNINAESDWGKGFFMGVLEELDVGYTIQKEHMKGDRPSGLNIEKVRNAMCLMVDELDKYNNYIFKVVNTMDIEEKFGFLYKVPVYARLFFNAQKSESLIGYVDRQIANRISVMEIETNYLIIDSKLYRENDLVYKEVIKEFVYNYFTKKINELIAAGEIQANKIATDRVNSIIAKYKIKAKSTHQLIVETIAEFLEDYKKYLELKAEGEQDLIYKRFTKREVELYERFIFYNEKNQKYMILKYENTVIEILKERLLERDFKKVEYSKGELLNIFEKYLKAENKTIHISELKTTKRALVIQEQNIYKYKEGQNEDSKTESAEAEACVSQASAAATDSQQPYSVLDLLNANIAYTANILKDFEELNNDKNKILLLTTLNSLLTMPSVLNSFTEIYNTTDVNTIINNFIKDKAELLKTLQLYKNETYIKNKLQKSANDFLPF